MIAALLFDFDGLLYDSETSAYEVWRELYAEHDAQFPLALWQAEVGERIKARRVRRAAHHLGLPECERELRVVLGVELAPYLVGRCL
jgi:beta-phosphoglucomutase-like phosphatase (HAD superfamily)